MHLWNQTYFCRSLPNQEYALGGEGGGDVDIRNGQSPMIIFFSQMEHKHYTRVCTQPNPNYSNVKEGSMAVTLCCWAFWMVVICWATTDNTSMSMRLNSSKQAHAPALKTMPRVTVNTHNNKHDREHACDGIRKNWRHPFTNPFPKCTQKIKMIWWKQSKCNSAVVNIWIGMQIYALLSDLSN